MIRSTIRSSIKASKHYLRMNAKELRHAAGVAWVRGKTSLAEMLEALAVEKGDQWRSGQHGAQNMPRGSSYFKGENRIVFGSKHLGAV